MSHNLVIPLINLLNVSSQLFGQRLQMMYMTA